MPGSVGPLTDTSIQVGTLDRLNAVERRNPQSGRPVYGEVAIFSTPETPTLSESGPYEADTGGAVVMVEARCRVAGTTASTVRVKHNGTVFATWNIAAGATRGVSYPSRRIGARIDTLTAEVTAVGTGVKAITIFIRMRP